MSNEKEVKLLEEKAREIMSGNYFVTINPEEFSSLKEIALCISGMKEQLATQLFEIQVAATQISSVSHKIEDMFSGQRKLAKSLYNQSIEISNKNTNNQKVVEKTVDESIQVQDMMNESRKSANKLVEIGNSAKNNINKQFEEILKIVNTINSISNSTDTTTKYIEHLNTSSEKITEILETVRNFSKQTHLVSINASIEAARAGHMGKGFSTIAEEVRRLANESSQSVDTIYDLINEISNDIKNVTKCNMQNKDNVSIAVENSQNVKKGLKEIEESYDHVLEKIDDINGMTNRSIDYLNKVRKTIEESSQSSKEISSGFDNIHSLVEEQYAQADTIEKLERRLQGAYTSLSVIADKLDIDILKNNEKMIEDKVQQIKELLTGHSKNKNLLSLEHKTHKYLLDKWLNEHPDMDAIWTNDSKGNFIYSNPPAGIANSSVRKWFQESIKGKLYVSSIYISSISKKPCITISIPIYNEGKIIGVLGSDIGI